MDVATAELYPPTPLEEELLNSLAEQLLTHPPEGWAWLLKRNNLPNVKSVHQIKQRADEFGINPKSALALRERYLRDQLKLWEQYQAGVSLIVPGPYGTILLIEEELEGLDRAREPVVIKDDEVTREMVERAREVRVDTLINFKNGKAHCPFHDDKIPSLFYGTRENRAVCPSGCNDSWDSISLTMKFHDLSFHDAVRKLCRGL